MALTVVEGFTWANGNTVMPTRLNNAIRSLVIQMAANKLLGTTGAGTALEIAYTAAGLTLLQAADAAAQRTALGLGTAALNNTGDFQPIDADLTAIAAIATTAYGRAFLALADATAGRTALGLGSIALQNSNSVFITGGSVKATQYEAAQAATAAVLDFSAETEGTITLAGNTNFTTSNLAAGRHKLIKILCDGTNRVIAFPGWKFVGGAAPTSILAGKTMLVGCISYTAADSGVVAAYSAEP